MALFKVGRGLEKDLPELNNGCLWFCIDTGNCYVDHLNAQNSLVRSKISAQYADKLRYKDNKDDTIEIDPSQILTSDNVIRVIGSATVEHVGFMSADDKSKLDSIETGATNNTITIKAWTAADVT